MAVMQDEFASAFAAARDAGELPPRPTPTGWPAVPGQSCRPSAGAAPGMAPEAFAQLAEDMASEVEGLRARVGHESGAE